MHDCEWSILFAALFREFYSGQSLVLSGGGICASCALETFSVGGKFVAMLPNQVQGIVQGRFLPGKTLHSNTGLGVSIFVKAGHVHKTHFTSSCSVPSAKHGSAAISAPRPSRS